MAPIIGTNSQNKIVIIGGSAGGGEIVDYVAQALLQILSGAPPLAALDAGHVSTARSHSSGLVELEMGRGIAELAEPLMARGHPIRIGALQSGIGFLVWKDRWLGAADPRRDGNVFIGQISGPQSR